MPIQMSTKTTTKTTTKQHACLTKAQRLKSPDDFQTVYQNKQWGNTRVFTFNVLATEQPSKLGVTVSKRVSKLAVRRNQIKRLIREFYRHHQHELSDAALVITAKPPANKLDNHMLYDELQELWAKLMKWQRWNAHQKKTQGTP